MNSKNHKNTSLLRRTITFTLMSTLLFMSVLALGSFGPKAANAQNSNDCAKLPINSIAK